MQNLETNFMKLKSIFILALSFGLLFIFQNCNSQKSASKNTSNAGLKSTLWTLTENPSLTLKIDTENKYSGFSGCNTYFGTLTQEQNSLKFGPAVTTRKSCPDLADENRYINLLAKVDRFEISGKKLKLFQGNLLLLSFSTL
ncbi:MAG: hypothetical protein C4K58_06175 [Flavobacteriaceae bacterium]|nr:MAG: hypothetical protein C4K58_06175 [Flavobacteriaceae bacterium]